mmetsp:Transcript_13610/g.16358  ORF Transcript_13610/g.16358 Transcript_13610/m.16358 type:complete len:140 (-) Transcript_13610:326-745(-)|eukprot:CAMPEP_0197856058 /NCGR_PEP_ID=MMETSP1438-20131217/27810_1 /TAXON_ID=1461541 /ORGANISM="Pterosperma sp., Strain CCMP1384" /LENGTH=139 /DNA_ID=CAMNT_0043471385 /DNA_START=408 /DNA_END=827 /DNA_ORIENTATION=+
MPTPAELKADGRPRLLSTEEGTRQRHRSKNASGEANINDDAHNYFQGMGAYVGETITDVFSSETRRRFIVVIAILLLMATSILWLLRGPQPLNLSGLDAKLVEALRETTKPHYDSADSPMEGVVADVDQLPDEVLDPHV